jgi:hypothetical protein
MSDRKVGLVQTALDPKNYDVLPPNIQTRTNFAKRFTVSGAWEVAPDPIVPPPGFVTTKSGALMWLPWRGIDTIYRLGLLAKGTSLSVLSNGLSYTFSFTRQLPLPYAVGTNSQVRVSPDASSDFSFTRLVAGCVTIVSNAFVIGNTAITGTLAAGVPNDTRDVFQNKQGDALTPDDLVQQSVTNKDSFQNKDMHQGAAMLLGSDIPSTHTVPDRDNYFSQNGASEVVSIINGSVPVAVTWNNVNNAHVTSRFVSAFGVELSSFPTLPGPAVLVAPSNSQVDAINICSGGVNITVVIGVTNASFTHAVYINTTGTFGALLEFQDCFSLIDGTTNVASINMLPPRVVLVPFQIVDNAGDFNLYRTTHEAFGVPGSIADRGLYIGTLVTVKMYSTSYDMVSAAHSAPSCDIGFLGLSVAPRDIYSDGELGPARFLRWDGVSDGQQIKVSGDLLVECVPEGTIAPYVTASEKLNVKALSVNQLPFLATLWNCNSPFRRIYTLSDYMYVKNEVVPNLTLPILLKWIESQGGDSAPVAHAAGFFSDMFDGIASVIKPIGTIASVIPGLQEVAAPLMLANTITEAAQHAFASGQYGQAAGQYGQAAGQYGQAAGQYGGKRGRYMD